MSRTLGEKRVVKTFNPAANPKVEEFKKEAAFLIDMINAIPDTTSQTARWKSLSMTGIEEGCIYAVKALTAGQDTDLDDGIKQMEG